MIQKSTDKEIIKFLDSPKCPFSYLDDEGNTLLILACKFRRKPIIIHLLALGYIDIDAINNYDETALMWCCKNNLNIEAQNIMSVSEIEWKNCYESSHIIKIFYYACENNLFFIADSIFDLIIKSGDDDITNIISQYKNYLEKHNYTLALEKFIRDT